MPNVVYELFPGRTSGQATGVAGGAGVAVWDAKANLWYDWVAQAFQALNSGNFPIATVPASKVNLAVAEVVTGSGLFFFALATLPTGWNPSSAYQVFCFDFTDGSGNSAVAPGAPQTVVINPNDNVDPFWGAGGGGGSVTDSSAQADVAAVLDARGLTSAWTTTVTTRLDTSVSSRSSPAAPQTIDLTTAVPPRSDATVGGALTAALANAFGDADADVVANTVTLKDLAGGVLVTFAEDNVLAPTYRHRR